MERYFEQMGEQLAHGVRRRVVPHVNGLDMFMLEAGEQGAPCALLLHGFPELAFSWRDVLLPLAQAGFHVIAPDQRGYGGTTGWSADYDGDLHPFRMLNLVRDQLALLAALNIRAVHLLVGHDFGSPVAAWAALVRPDLFKRVVLMSAPFAGPPGLPPVAANPTIHEELAALPVPRRHYQAYYSTRTAEADMLNCAQGFESFLRAYYHYKSADWAGNQPQELAGWTAAELARMPTYYVMRLDEDMSQTCAPFMPDVKQTAENRWLTDAELSVYAGAFRQTGLQGGLNWYRCGMNGWNTADFTLFSGRTIEVPTLFIAGQSDWGIHQRPGEYGAMQRRACSRFIGARLIEGAGHWVQQEQPEAVVNLLREFALT